jgi:hypothetical protein
MYVTDFDVESGDTPTIRFKYGATTIVQDTSITAASALTNQTGKIMFDLIANGATNAQTGFSQIMVGTGAIGTLVGQTSISVGSGTATEDSTVSKTLAVTVANNSGASNSITLNGFVLELIIP